MPMTTPAMQQAAQAKTGPQSARVGCARGSATDCVSWVARYYRFGREGPLVPSRSAASVPGALKWAPPISNGAGLASFQEAVGGSGGLATILVVLALGGLALYIGAHRA